MAERAKVSDTPWDVVQCRAVGHYKWLDKREFPEFNQHTQYRIKPQLRVIDWGEVGKDVPVMVWDCETYKKIIFFRAYDGSGVYCFTANNGARWRHASLETGSWVANVGGVNPWPPGCIVEVEYRNAAVGRDELVASEVCWMRDNKSLDIIASRCVGLQEGWAYE
jgi:hypothetical protein